MINFLN